MFKEQFSSLDPKLETIKKNPILKEVTKSFIEEYIEKLDKN